MKVTNVAITLDGKQLNEPDGTPITFFSAVVSVLKGSQYESSQDLLTAASILPSMKGEGGSTVELNPDELALIKKLSSTYKPLLAGTTFVGFFQTLNGLKETNA